MRIFLFIIFYLILFTAGAQTATIDSLLQQLDKITQKKQRVKVLIALSYEYNNVDLFKALEYADESMKLADQLGYDSLSIATRLNQATIAVRTGDYSRALELCTYVVQESKKISAPFMEAMATTNIGTIHYQNRESKEALNYYLTSLQYFSEERMKTDRSIVSRRALIMNNAGVIYEEAKKFDSANYYYQRALKLSEQAHDSVNMANVLNNFGTLYRDQGDTALAITYYNKAKTIREQSNDKFGLARSNYSIGTFYYKILNDGELAEPYLKKSAELGSEIGAWRTAGSAYSLLHQLYKRQGQYSKAYDALVLTRQINDSLFNKESTRKIAQLEMQSEFDRKQAEQDVKQKEKELHYYMGAGGLIFLLIIVTLLFFLQRSKTKRSQLEQVHLELEKKALKNDLATKDRELAANIMYLLNKNELINTISEKLLTIKEQVNVESQSAVQKVVLDLQSNLQPEVWQEFEVRFQQVHARFYKALNEKFPDLSPSERRLCAFLKLDMTTKEISSITHQNAKSIDVARTRLRKKLNLTGTDNNLVTFLSQLDKSESAG